MIGQVVGHYRVIEFLGSGESGSVYRAEDLRRHRLVALRILPASFFRSLDAAGRFTASLDRAALVEHPAVPRIYERGEDDQFRYQAMQLVEGEPLDRRLIRGSLAPEEAVRIAWEAASALEAAHGIGVVHGGLRSADLVLTAGGVRVLGFGGGGAPADGAPAPLPGDDLLALGRILREMVAGREDRLPASLERTIRVATDPDPAARPQNAAAFRSLLQQAGIDLNARLLARAPLTRRRRRHFGTLLPTVAAIAILILIWLGWHAMRWRFGK